MKAEQRRRLRIKLSQKFIIGFILLSIVLSGGLCYVGYQSINEKYMEFYSVRANSAAGIAAGLVNGDDIPRYIETGAPDARYDEVLQRLNVVKQSTGMQYIYVFYPHPDGYLYLYDAVIPGDDPAGANYLGDLEPYVTTHDNLERAFATGEPVEKMLVTDTEAGGFVGTVFTPVKDSAGKVVALVGVDVAMPEVKTELRNYLVKSLSATVALVVVAVMIYLLYLRRSVILPIRKLTDSVIDYTKDSANLQYQPVPIRTGDEIETLGQSFEKMAGDIDQYMNNLKRVTADKQRIATELDVATNIQMSMLPRVFPPFPQCADFSIYATIQPAKEVGGDFYDFFRLDENRLCFVVADVSGKGVPAALFMMIAKALIKNQAQSECAPSDTFSIVNNQLAEGNEASMFVTALIMVLDTKQHTLTWCNAGHNPPLIRHKDGTFEYLKIRRSLPLAAMEGMRYREESCPFEADDMMFLYTDGVTEALNPREELYGEPRLKAALDAIKAPDGMTLEEILARVRTDVERFVDGAPQADDITMLMVKTNI